MLPPQKYAFFALTGEIYKVNNFSPAETTLFLRDFSFNSLAQRHISLAKTYLFWCA